MELKVNEVEISVEDFNSYMEQIVNRIFKILGIYENCDEINNFETFDTYVFRVISEIRGFSELVDTSTFISLSSLLTDLKTKVHEDSLKEVKNRTYNHKAVKSIVFHCISLVKREKRA